MKQEEIINKIYDYVKNSEQLIDYKIIDFSKKIHFIKVNEYEISVKELTWKEILNIDLQSHISHNGNLLYSENLKKNKILNSAIISVKPENYNIENLDSDVLNKIWEIYQQYLHISLDEINFLYKSSKKYFSVNERENFPIHPLIIEVDYMLQGIVHFSKTEFENLTIREFEAIQLIISAKNEIS